MRALLIFHEVIFPPLWTDKGFELSFSTLGSGQFAMFWFKKFRCNVLVHGHFHGNIGNLL